MKILVGLSGGVDSAVAAYLLKEQGHEVVAGFMKNYTSESGNCTTYNDAIDAIKVAEFLGIEIRSFDLQKEYQERIIDYIFAGYQKGITPNPDVLCNSLIKFDVFLKKALEAGFDKIATGHYARIEKSSLIKGGAEHSEAEGYHYESSINIPPTPLIEGGTSNQLVNPSFVTVSKVERYISSRKQGDQKSSLIKGGAEHSEAEGYHYESYFLPYNPAINDKAKALRKNMTKAEQRLRFEYLKTLNEKVLRQHPIGNYIVDFYIASKKLVIEVDGETHRTDQEIAYDGKRTAFLEQLGLRVLRVTNTEVFQNLSGVVEKIETYFNIPPTPLKKGGLQVDTPITPFTYRLLRGVDHHKDQSYFLAGLTQFQLQHSVFPLWELTKPEVRAIAEKIGLPNASRKDSQGLCFIGNVPIKQFLLQKFPIKKGEIRTLEGKTVGTHDGAYFFTIGQKQGLGLNFKAYVYRIDIENNIVYVCDKEAEELQTQEIVVKDWHWIAEEAEIGQSLTGKIRYRQNPPVACEIFKKENTEISIRFSEPQRAVAPGQVFVLYDGEICLGSGIMI